MRNSCYGYLNVYVRTEISAFPFILQGGSFTRSPTTGRYCIFWHFVCEISHFQWILVKFISTHRYKDWIKWIKNEYVHLNEGVIVLQFLFQTLPTTQMSTYSLGKTVYLHSALISLSIFCIKNIFHSILFEIIMMILCIFIIYMFWTSGHNRIYQGSYFSEERRALCEKKNKKKYSIQHIWKVWQFLWQRTVVFSIRNVEFRVGMLKASPFMWGVIIPGVLCRFPNSVFGTSLTRLYTREMRTRTSTV